VLCESWFQRRSSKSGEMRGAPRRSRQPAGRCTRYLPPARCTLTKVFNSPTTYYPHPLLSPTPTTYTYPYPLTYPLTLTQPIPSLLSLSSYSTSSVSRQHRRGVSQMSKTRRPFHGCSAVARFIQSQAVNEVYAERARRWHLRRDPGGGGAGRCRRLYV
jgi:hypothetical protein